MLLCKWMRLADTWPNGSQIRIEGLPPAIVTDRQFIFPKLTDPALFSPFVFISALGFSIHPPESVSCLSTTKNVWLGFSSSLQGPKYKFPQSSAVRSHAEPFLWGSEEHFQLCFVLTHYCLCPCEDTSQQGWVLSPLALEWFWMYSVGHLSPWPS